jgi:hypothetical protein
VMGYAIERDLSIGDASNQNLYIASTARQLGWWDNNTNSNTYIHRRPGSMTPKGEITLKRTAARPAGSLQVFNNNNNNVRM